MTQTHTQARTTGQTDRQRGGAGAGAHTHTPHPTGFVYFIEAVGLRAVKIGFSHDPQHRLAELQPSCPVQLRLLAAVPGTESIESTLHHKFLNQRIHGEWFHLEKDSPLDRMVKSIDAGERIRL